MNTKKRNSCILLVCCCIGSCSCWKVDLLNKLLPPCGQKRQQQSAILNQCLHKDEYSELFILSVTWLRAGNGFTTITESTVCFWDPPQRWRRCWGALMTHIKEKRLSVSAACSLHFQPSGRRGQLGSSSTTIWGRNSQNCFGEAFPVQQTAADAQIWSVSSKWRKTNQDLHLFFLLLETRLQQRNSLSWLFILAHGRLALRNKRFCV